MSDARMTSTGYAVSDAPWLNLHFRTCRAEYEDALRFIGIEPGWAVLDAGCGSGGYIPLLCELVGPQGRSPRSIWRLRVSPGSNASSKTDTAPCP